MKSTKKVLIFSLALVLIFGNFLFFSKIAKAEVTVSNVIATPRSSTTMHLQWDSTYSDNTIIHYKTSDMTDWIEYIANCYDKINASARECQAVLNYLVPGDIYSYKFKEGELSQEQVYSYFVMPTDIEVNQINVKNITNNSAIVSWSSNEKLNSKVFYYPSSNEFDQKTISDSIFTNNHNIALTNLKPNTEYKYQIISLNQEGGGLISSWNNMLTFTTTNKPDLTIKDIYLENDLIKVKYCNNGSSFQSGKYFYIKMTANGKTHTGTSNNSNYLFEVPASATCKNTDGYPISYFGLTGEYTFEVKAEIDWENNIDETDENNNTLTKTIIINSGKPDLTIKNVYFSPQNPKVDEPFNGQVRVEIANLGESGVIKEFPVSVVLSSNWILLDWADIDQTIFVNDVVAGSTQILSFNLKKDYIFQNKNLEVRAWADSNGVGYHDNLKNDNLFIDESNENNNTFYKKITLAENKPDLTIQDVYLENDLIKVKYCNNGSSSQSGKYFYIKITANGKTHTGTSNNSNYIFEVPAPETCKNTDGYPISYFGLTGEYTFEVKAEIDWENNIDETDENNNTLTKTINITPKIQTPISPTTPPQISKRLSGKLLLDVDQGGAIWFVDNMNYKRHNVKWNNALNIFQMFALGITDDDLLKIPAKTESINQDLDTDGDGYKDEHELKKGYSPYNNKLVKFKLDNKVGQRLKGRFLLQVQKGGAIWYVDSNGYRHSVRWNNLRPLFESLALGITNFDLKKIEEE